MGCLEDLFYFGGMGMQVSGLGLGMDFWVVEDEGGEGRR